MWNRVDSSELKDRTDIVRRQYGLLNAISSLSQPIQSTISRALRSRRLNALLEILRGGGGGSSGLQLRVYIVKG